MKPNLLRIKGINSFQEEQSIDFNVLTEGGIFGIFGPTGSGKSTVLDGITLALYGKMARNSSDFINVNEKRATVVFEFSISGVKTKKYRVSREFVRNKEGGINQQKCQFLELHSEGDRVLADKATEVTQGSEKIIGLGWQDFVRTVVLPQGKFSEFLKLKGSERREMLERLFNLSQFGEDLTKRLKEERVKETEILHRLEGELKGYEEVNQEIFIEKSKEWENLKIELKEIQKSLKALKIKLDEGRILWEQQKELTLALKENEKIEEEAPEIKNKEKSLEAGKRALSIVLPMEDLQKLSLDIENKNKIVKELVEKWKISKNNDVNNEIEWKKSEAYKNEKVPELLKELPKILEGLKFLEEKEKLDSEISLIIEKYNKGVETLGSKTQEIESLEMKANVIEKSLKNLEEREKECRVSPAQREKIARGLKGEEKKEELKSEFEKVQRERKGILEIILKEEEENQRIKEKEEDLKKIIGKKDEELREVEKNKPKTREEIQSIKDDNFTMLLRKKLFKGEPCPICGATEHPIIVKGLVPEILDEEIKELIRKLENWEEEIKDLENQKNALEKEALILDGKRKVKNQELKDLKEKEKEKLQKIKEIQENLKLVEISLKALSEETKMGNYKEESKQLVLLEEERSLLLPKIDKKRFELNEERKKIVNEKEKIGELKENLREDKTRCAEKRDQRKEKLQKIKEEVGENKTREGLMVSKACIEKEIEEITNQWKVLNEKREKLKTESQEIAGKINEEKASLETMKNQEEKSRIRITKELISFGFRNWDEARVACLSLKEIESLEGCIKTYQEKKLKLKGKLEDLKEKINEKAIEDEVYLDLQEKWEIKEKEEKEMKKSETRLEALVEQLEEKVKEKIKLKSDEEEQSKKLGLIAELESLFKGKKFVEFVAISRLKYISLEASKRLGEISHGSYGLETDENGQFIIRDYKNGGIPRDPSTLSGGETFLASLALALALSSEIQLKGTAPLEFFFLDEGFGSLHEDALDVVMNSIEMLHHQRLKVGIISHVESVKNRMPVKLILTPGESGVGGSKVRIEK